MIETSYVNDLLAALAVKHRRHFHQHPELSGQEYNTATYIREELEKLDIEIKTDFSAPNVIGFLKGTKGEKTIALRADMDALAIPEEGNKAYTSLISGISHACGHDGHMAILLAVAKWLSENRHLLQHHVLFIFQSSEEMSPSGADQLVKEGVLNEVDEIYGIHLWQDLPLGKLGFTPGAAMASCDDFEIKIEGIGGHGGQPHLAVDPIYIATHLIQAFQSIISRSLNPMEAGVISFGSIQSGSSSYNVIPASVTIKGTVRAMSYHAVDLMRTRMEELTTSICESFQAKGTFTFITGTPPLVNDPEACHDVEKVIQHAYGNEVIQKVEPIMGAEDFSYYLKAKKGAFIFVGMQSDKSQYPHHHPKFDIDENALPIAIDLMIRLALGVEE